MYDCCCIFIKMEQKSDTVGAFTLIHLSHTFYCKLILPNILEVNYHLPFPESCDITSFLGNL